MTQAPEDYPAFRKIIESSARTLCWGNGDPIVDRIDVADDFQALLASNASLRAVMGELVETLDVARKELIAWRNGTNKRGDLTNLSNAKVGACYGDYLLLWRHSPAPTKVTLRDRISMRIDWDKYIYERLESIARHECLEILGMASTLESQLLADCAKNLRNVIGQILTQGK